MRVSATVTGAGFLCRSGRPEGWFGPRRYGNRRHRHLEERVRLATKARPEKRDRLTWQPFCISYKGQPTVSAVSFRGARNQAQLAQIADVFVDERRREVWNVVLGTHLCRPYRGAEHLGRVRRPAQWLAARTPSENNRRVCGKSPKELPKSDQFSRARPSISMRAAHRGRGDTGGGGQWAQRCALGITGCPTVRCCGWTLRWGVGWAGSTRPP
jgi:hypothetical protein